jgi:hypothetical protein
VKLVHVADALSGLAFIMYNILIMTQSKKHVIEVVIAAMTYGSSVLHTSSMWGDWRMSAYSSPSGVNFYVFTIILVLNSSGLIFRYLIEYLEFLDLNKAAVATLQRDSLAAVELCR